MSTTNVNEMLAGRQARYGTFEGHARISQALKRAMQDSPNWSKLTDVLGVDDSRWEITIRRGEPPGGFVRVQITPIGGRS